MRDDLVCQSGPHEAQDVATLLAQESAALVEWLVERHQVDLRAQVRVLRPALQGGGPRSERLRNNRRMLQTWIPDMVGAQHFGAEESTGEAIEWCRQQGAALGNMGSYQGYAAVAHPHGSIVSWTTVEMGGILLGPDGMRMGDESAGYSGFATTVAAHAAESHVVSDTRIRDYVTAHEVEFSELVDAGGLREAEDAASVATLIGADPETIRRELTAYEQAAGGMASDAHGRTDFGMAPLQPPYCVVRSVPALFHTQGGALVDESARVRRDGGVVPGLFAGGGVAAGLSGTTGAAGYSSGNGLLSAVGLGRIADRNATS